MGFVLALVGIGLMVGLSGAGSAIGLVIGGSALIGAVKKKPEMYGSGLILSALPSTQGLYGFVGFILYNNRITTELTLLQGSVVFGAGIAMGIACLVSAIWQGRVCANGISAMGQGHNVFGNAIVLGAFPEFYAILSLVAAVLMQALLA
jgi:V/A-type H+/Na+-transporting ATPase subunit K